MKTYSTKKKINKLVMKSPSQLLRGARQSLFHVKQWSLGMLICLSLFAFTAIDNTALNVKQSFFKRILTELKVEVTNNLTKANLLSKGQAGELSFQAFTGPFGCSPAFYQIIEGSLEILNINTGVYDDLAVNSAGDVNAIGYNPNDNYIYGFADQTNLGSYALGDVVRLEADGTTTVVHSGTGESPIAGDMDDNNLLWFRANGNQGRRLKNVNVVTGIVSGNFDFSGPDIRGSTGITHGDLVYLVDAVNGDKVYSMGNDRQLTIWNFGTSTVTRLAVSGWVYGTGSAGTGTYAETVTFGAGWTDSDGNIYFSNNGNPGKAAVWRIDAYTTGTPTATWVNDSQDMVQRNDGASCPLAQNPFVTVETDCGDMADNDNDGDIDCNDLDCFPLTLPEQIELMSGNTVICIAIPFADIGDYGVTVDGNSAGPLTSCNSGNGVNVDVGTFVPHTLVVTRTASNCDVTIPITPPCKAGTNTPNLSQNSIDNICLAVTADLTSITANNYPTTTDTISLEWHTVNNPTDNSTLVAKPKFAIAGTYYAIFHDTIFDCYSMGTAATVTINACPNNSISNICPSTTVDLDALQGGTPPSGTTLIWSTDNDGSDGLSSTETSPTSNSGTYYAYYYDATNTCYSPASNAVSVTVISCFDPCEHCSTASCTTASIDNQTTAFEKVDGIGANEGCNPSITRTVSDGDTTTFCATFTTPAVLEENFISFFGSVPIADIGCDASQLINWQLTENCTPVTAASFQTVPPNLPTGVLRPVWQIEPNTTYEMCYDVVVSGTCSEISTPCFAPHWVPAPCFLIVGTADQDCSRNDGTYDLRVSFSGGGQGAGTYILTNNGTGTLGGDDPNTMTSGTIIVSNIPDGSGYDLDITGNGTTSGCTFEVTTQSYTCSFCPKITTATVAKDDCVNNTVTLAATVDGGVEGEDYYIEWLANGTPINKTGSSTFGLDGIWGTADDPTTALTYVHTLSFENTVNACSFEDQVFTARLYCKSSDLLQQGNINTASTTSSVVSNYNALEESCIGLDLTNLPNGVIAENFDYQYRVTSGPPFGLSWICEAVLSIKTPAGSSNPICHPFWGNSCPTQPAGPVSFFNPVGPNATTCFSGPGNGAGTTLNPSSGGPAMVELGGVNSTTVANGNWQICVFDTYNDNNNGTEGVLNYIYLKVNYFLPPGVDVNFPESSIVDAVNISSPIIAPSAPTTTASHPQGAGLVTGLRVCNTPVVGVDFTLPNSNDCETAIALNCSEGIVRYSSDNGANYLLTSPPAPYLDNQVVYYQVTTADCSFGCGAIGTYTLTNCSKPPIAANDFLNIPEDTSAVIIDVLSNDTDPTNDPLTTTVIGSSTQGVTPAVINGDSITYTPPMDFNGMDTITYQVCDNGSPALCDTAIVVVTVDPVNDKPVAVDDATNVDEDTPITVDVQDNDTNVDGDLLTTTIIGTSTQGITPTVENGDSITYTAPMDFNGMDTVTYQICDNGSPALCDTAIVVITVDPVNDKPVANDDATNVDEDTPITVDVQDNDTDLEGDLLTTTIISTTTEGVTPVVENGDSITYTPPLNFNGMDTITYQICDNGSPMLCDTAIVVITVDPVNDKPVAVDDATNVDEDTPVTVDVQDNDSDVDGDPLTTTIIGTSTQGVTPTIENGDSITYTPPLNFNGMDTITYQICDNGSPALCDTAIVVITVDPVNDKPVAVDDAETTDEDIPVTVDVQDNDSDVDGDLLTTTIIGTTTEGVTPVVENGDSITYTPPLNFNGMDTITYQVCDNGSPALCDTAIVVITVDPVNDKPVAVDDGTNVDEDTPVTVDVQDNDTDVDGDPLTTTIIGTTTQGVTPVLENGDSITYMPPMDFNGMDTITYQICDNGSPALCDTAIVVITVDPINDKPVAVDDGTNVDEDTPVTVDVQDNDSDVDGDLLTTTIIDTSTQGVTPVVENGDSITYTPPLNFNGMDTITYQICDNGSPMLCDTAIVVITVDPVNDKPAAVDDATNINEDTPVTVDVQDNDSDVDGNPLTTTIIGTTTQGVTPVVENGDSIIYTPPMDFNGMDTITYQICDNGSPALCDTAIVVITVDPVNDKPVAVDDATNVDEDTPVTVDVQDNDTDVEGDPLTTTIIGTTTQGITPVVENGDSITYTPPLNFNGMDTITYQVCDNGSPALCDTAIVVITVDPVNDKPVAVDDATNVDEDTPVTVDVQDNDTDVEGDPLTTTIIGTTTQGITPVVENGDSITYMPPLNFNGMDTITYQVCDNGSPALCDTTIVVITVDPVNDKPVAVDDATNVDEDTPITVDVQDNDSDVDGDPLTTTIIGTSTQGVTPIVENGDSITYTPPLNFNGMDTITYQICDNGSPMLCDTAIVVITVDPVNDKPVAVDDATNVDEDTPATVDVQGNDSDVESASLTTTIIGTSTQGVTPVVENGDSITYTPPLNFNGMDTITYQVCDNGSPALCDTAIVVITVDPVNDKPVAVDDATNVDEDTPITVDAQNNDSDVDGDPLATTIIGTSTQGVTPVLENGDSITYTPPSMFFGMDTITYQICDNGSPALCDTAIVVITVDPVNDPLMAIDDINTTTVDVPVSGNVLVNDEDQEMDSLFVDTTPINPMNGTVVIDPQGNYTFTPDAGFIGEATFQYKVCDAGTPSLCDTATVTIQVIDNSNTANNDVIGVEDNFTTEEGSPVSGDLLANDSDPDGDNIAITITPVTSISTGSLMINSNGTFTFTPALGFTGEENFEYEVCDDGTPQSCDTVMVMIEVLYNDGENDVYATDDANTAEEGVTQTGNVTDNDNDPENGILTVNSTPVSDVTNGTLTLNTDGTYSYEPNAGFFGNDQFRYSVCDDSTPVACDTATVYLTVLETQNPPLVIPTPITTPQDSTVDVCLPIFDDNMGDTFTANLCSGSPINGIATPIVNGSAVCVTYTPTAGFSGTDDICIIVCDQTGRCDTTSIPVTIVPPVPENIDSLAPIVIPTPITTPQDSTTSICTPILDANVGDTFTANLCTGSPANGTATPTVNGNELCLEYTPNAAFVGDDEICVIVCDNTGLCDTVIIPVQVIPTPQPEDTLQAPIAVLPPIVTPEDSITTTCGTITDANPGDTHIVTVCEQPANGTVTLSMDNATNELCMTFDPDTGFEGIDSVCISVCDQTGLCDTVNVPIVVLPRATQLKIKMMLQGAMIGTSDGLMRDDLRQQGFIPLNEPYDSLNTTGQFLHVGGGNEITNNLVLSANTGTSDAIVDWVFVELRDPTDSTTIVHTISALVQRDGDVVAAHTGGDLIVTSVPRSFFVSVKHRNHLGTMTATALPVVGEMVIIDFTTKTSLELFNNSGYDGLEMTTMTGKRALWMGNTNKDIKTKYDGAANDRIIANFEVITNPGNVLQSLNFDFGDGYYQGDVNLDGKVKYDGIGNDRVLIQNVILTYPLNTIHLRNYNNLLEQLP